MTKRLTKLWLGGMKKMLRTPASRLPAVIADAIFAAPPATEAVPPRAASAEGAPHFPWPPRESRVRPRAAAWAEGEWSRGEHPLPFVVGRFVSHLGYALYVPDGLPAGAPLVVMLHGCKQDAAQFAQGTRMNLLADRHGFAVLYPEQSIQAHSHGCWHWYDDTERGGRGEARAVVDLVDTLVAARGLDASRVYAAGLSAGAGLATLLALHFPDRFAAIALHSGPAFGDAHSGITAMDVMRRGLHRAPAAIADSYAAPGTYPGMPALIVHGDDDSVVSPANADHLAIEFLRLNGLADADGEPSGVERIDTQAGEIRLLDYRRDGRPVVRVCHVAGLDHAWAGGDDTVPFHASAGPDASTMVWGFFADKQRQTATI
ncbi:PHB depolymerase family esterase [Burkholderia glumae]|uniref:PHB depolymerase family esterase n=1 Tax=Burkholderia glumae TaxID=337 RepID=A0AAP9XVZ6_BURGL|nr:PHB depolymerase family esterase [Burkholderia glumae]AJY62633.1 esterase, PHB depolymerase family protein [Burkholderia glumae LMG 2196 = ATCC 33617]KHJ63989.1 esterase [Burkholderia glumae]MCM2484866.1 PHB depolymerase family esterase [Burkholderia glumae]MCM2495247.1 PHB depolymerase family esterase [Burkholderia glumae]MCM2510559.1 PHB depolymerase family esterase [Burkholderia glumae]